MQFNAIAASELVSKLPSIEDRGQTDHFTILANLNLNLDLDPDLDFQSVLKASSRT